MTALHWRLYRDARANLICKILAKVEAEAVAFNLVNVIVLDTVKFFEDALLKLFGDPGAFVGDADVNPIKVRFNRDDDFAILG
jgi:hypothetical protein